MATLNKVFLLGRLTADPELRQTQSNIPVTSFTLAINRRVKQGEEQKADFIDIVAWRSNAEFASKYFKKGMAAFVSGSLQIRTWKDNQGNNRKSAEVVADEIQFAEPKRDNYSKSDYNEPTFTAGAPKEDFEEMSSDDELPF